VNLHLRDHRLGWRYREVCLVDAIADVFGSDPLAKQKQACVTKQIFDVVGYSAWAVN
jgi:hypothetical protein